VAMMAAEVGALNNILTVYVLLAFTWLFKKTLVLGRVWRDPTFRNMLQSLMKS
jgi:hypothetical protein